MTNFEMFSEAVSQRKLFTSIYFAYLWISENPFTLNIPKRKFINKTKEKYEDAVQNIFSLSAISIDLLEDFYTFVQFIDQDPDIISCQFTENEDILRVHLSGIYTCIGKSGLVYNTPTTLTDEEISIIINRRAKEIIVKLTIFDYGRKKKFPEKAIVSSDKVSNEIVYIIQTIIYNITMAYMKGDFEVIETLYGRQ